MRESLRTIKRALRTLTTKALSSSDSRPPASSGDTDETFNTYRDLRVNGRTFSVRGDSYLDRMGSDFEPGMAALLDTISRNTTKGACLDIGANIGITALMLSKLHEQVYCFEASPRTHQILEYNLSSNNASNVSAFAFGLGKSNQTLTLTAAANDASGGFTSSFLNTPLDGHVQETVEVRRGDEALAAIDTQLAANIRLIKIDVEGSELEVIEGLHNTLMTSKPVVVLEMNHWCLNAFKRISVPEFLEKLDGYFPVIAAYDDSTQKIINVSNEMKSNRYFVMHEHIVKNMFPTLVCLQEESTLAALEGRFKQR